MTTNASNFFTVGRLSSTTTFTVGIGIPYGYNDALLDEDGNALLTETGDILLYA